MGEQECRYQDLSIFQVPGGFRGRSVLWVQLWWLVQRTLFAWSPQLLFPWRVFLLRLFGARVGRGVRIRSSATVTFPWKLVVGDYVWIGDDSIVYNLGPVDIGSHVAIAHRVVLCTGSHDVSQLAFDITQNGIVVRREAWIANDVFVAPGVEIGEGCVIGARSTVLSDMPSGMICFGNPCRAVKPRPSHVCNPSV